MSRPQQLGAIAVIALTFAGYLALQPQRASQVDSSTALAAISARQKTPPDRDEKHVHDEQLPLDSNDPQVFRQQQHWYDPLPDTTPPQNTPLQWDASCARSPLLRFNQLETLLNQQARWRPIERTPDDILVEEIVQFWQLDGRYFQLAGRWQRDQPATYELTHFSASNAEMSTDVRRLNLPGEVPTSFDVLALGDYLDKRLNAVEKQGALVGARLLHVLPAGPSGAMDLKLNNGRIVSFAFGEGLCQRRNSGAAYCRCTAPSTPEDHSTEEPYRVVD